MKRRALLASAAAGLVAAARPARAAPNVLRYVPGSPTPTV